MYSQYEYVNYLVNYVNASQFPIHFVYKTVNDLIIISAMRK